MKQNKTYYNKLKYQLFYDVYCILNNIAYICKKTMNMENTSLNLQKQLKRTEISLAVTTAMTQMGLTSGELTYTAAVKVYGQWFANAVRNGRIEPSRIGNGRTATKWFSIADILAYKAVEIENAQLILSR